MKKVESPAEVRLRHQAQRAQAAARWVASQGTSWRTEGSDCYLWLVRPVYGASSKTTPPP